MTTSSISKSPPPTAPPIAALDARVDSDRGAIVLRILSKSAAVVKAHHSSSFTIVKCPFLTIEVAISYLHEVWNTRYELETYWSR